MGRGAQEWGGAGQAHTEARKMGCSWMGERGRQLRGKAGETKAGFIRESNERVRKWGQKLEGTPVRDRKLGDKGALGAEEKHKGGSPFTP